MGEVIIVVRLGMMAYWPSGVETEIGYAVADCPYPEVGLNIDACAEIMGCYACSLTSVCSGREDDSGFAKKMEAHLLLSPIYQPWRAQDCGRREFETCCVVGGFFPILGSPVAHFLDFSGSAEAHFESEIFDGETCDAEINLKSIIIKTRTDSSLPVIDPFFYAYALGGYGKRGDDEY